MTRQTLLRIHLWLSLPLGIIITLICLSGATLVFKHEIRSALGMPTVVAPHGTHHAASDKSSTSLHAQGKAAAMGHGKTAVNGHGHSTVNGHEKMGGDKHGASAHHGHGTTTKRDFFSYVTRFHTSLMMGTVGKIIVTYTTLFFLVILVSGLWICWPRNGSQWRQRFKVTRGKGIRRLFYDLHVSLGYWTVLWLVLLAVTGAAFGLHLLPHGSTAIKVFHALHVGAWGGILTKTITFVVSLIGASLPLTGYWLYFKKWK